MEGKVNQHNMGIDSFLKGRNQKWKFYLRCRDSYKLTMFHRGCEENVNNCCPKSHQESVQLSVSANFTNR